MLANRRVLATGVMIFFSVATDLGFVYWLSEYFKTELGGSLRLSSSVAGMYLAGIILGRLLMPLVLKRLRAETLLPASLALGGILAFILVPGPGAKAALCAVYGLSVGPVFPLLMARGTREFPEQSGAVSGILYAGIALGGDGVSPAGRRPGGEGRHSTVVLVVRRRGRGAADWGAGDARTTRAPPRA